MATDARLLLAPRTGLLTLLLLLPLLLLLLGMAVGFLDLLPLLLLLLMPFVLLPLLDGERAAAAGSKSSSESWGNRCRAGDAIFDGNNDGDSEEGGPPSLPSEASSAAPSSPRLPAFSFSRT